MTHKHVVWSLAGHSFVVGILTSALLVGTANSDPWWWILFLVVLWGGNLLFALAFIHWLVR